jgi:hypothetical protein
MAISAFSRAARSILNRLGEDALLRGAPTDGRVNVEHSVEMQGDNGEVVVAHAVATMLVSNAPKRGDALVVGGVAYVIDGPPFANNGYSLRVVLRDA